MRKPSLPYANNKGADQPDARSLISAFVIHCSDSVIPLISISEISSLYIASVAAQAGLSHTWSKTPKTGFLVTRLQLKLSLRWEIRYTMYVGGSSFAMFAFLIRDESWLLFWKAMLNGFFVCWH